MAQILHGDRHAVETTPVQTSSDFTVGFPGCLQRHVGRNRGVAAELAVELSNALQQGSCHFDR